LIRKLDKLDKIEVDDIDGTKVRIAFPPAPHAGKVILEGFDVGKSYGDLHLFSKVNFQIVRGEKVALIGKNGVGKSSMLRMIMNQEAYDGELKIGYSVEVGYYAQNQSDILDGEKTVFQTIDDEAVGDIRKGVRGLLGAFLFSGDDIDKKVKVLSGGEKARLAFCKLLLQPYNFLVLDEPTNHLDLASKEVLKNAIAKYDGTVLLVSHDRDFLDGLTQKVFEIQADRMVVFPGDVKEFLRDKKATSIALYENEKVIKQQEKIQKEETFVEPKPAVKIDKTKEKEIKKVEGDIEKKELQMAELENEMSTMDYTNLDLVNSQNTKYEQLKKELERLMEKWENLAAE
jgi:ATP-binding cassette subfamily F protein 3